MRKVRWLDAANAEWYVDIDHDIITSRRRKPPFDMTAAWTIRGHRRIGMTRVLWRGVLT